MPDLPEGMSREDMLKEVFKYADDDKSGALSIAEYKQLAKDMSDKKTTEMAVFEMVFEMADTKADGKLTLQEFTEFNLESGKGLDDAKFREQALQWLQLAKLRIV